MKIQLISNVSCYREKFMIEHYIRNYDLFILCGKGVFVVNENGKDYTVHENQGFFFKKNVFFHRIIKEPAQLFLFRFVSDSEVFRSSYITFCDTARIKSTISMLENLDKKEVIDDFVFRKHLFKDIVNQYLFENKINTDFLEKHDLVMERAANAICDSIEKKMPLTEICESTGLSYVQFIRRFKAYTGLSPANYLKGLRIRRAKEMLAETDLLIKDIATYCGFENEYYFSNYFKNNTGMSPSDFRATLN